LLKLTGPSLGILLFFTKGSGFPDSGLYMIYLVGDADKFY